MGNYHIDRGGGESFDDARHGPFADMSQADKFFNIMRHSSSDLRSPDRRKGSIPDLDKALSALETVENHQVIPDRGRLELIADAKQISEMLQALNYRDYRSLIGELRFWRSQGAKSGADSLYEASAQRVDPFPIIAERLIGFGASPQLKELLKILSNAYSNAFLTESQASEGGSLRKQFIDDTLLLMRCVCAQGVNMLNPSWDEKKPVAFNDEQRVALELGKYVEDESPENRRWDAGDRVLLVPSKDGYKTRLLYYSPRALRRGRPPELVGEIADGESIVVGKTLSLTSLYGLQAGRYVTRVKAPAEIPNECYSRGCLRILKFAGLYFFNAGARNTFRVHGFDGTEWQHASFLGQSIADGGTYTFGQSQITRVDGPPPGEDDASRETGKQ